MNPWLAIASVLGALAALALGLWLWQRRRNPHPELLRKLFHVGAGGITLSFPWLFDSAWPVLLLGLLAIAGLAAAKLFARRGQGPGTVLHGVARDSLGEMYFPAAVAGLFVLAGEEPLLYVVPLLVLTLADAVAALVGVRYGRARYSTSEGEKSVEGSIAFLMVAFLSVHIPLLLFSELGRLETLLIAVVIGLLVMLLEAAAWRGMDNLFIPLGSYLLLQTYWEAGATDLALLLLVTAALVGFTWWWRTRTTLNDSTALAAALIGYLIWAIGGWTWLIPPLIVFVGYVWLSPRTEANSASVHGLRALLSVAAPGLLWLTIAAQTARPELIYPYTLAFAAQLAIIGVARLRHQYPERSPQQVWAGSAFKAWIFLLLPFAALGLLEIVGPTADYLLAAQVLLGGTTTLLAAVAFSRLQPGLDDCPTDTPRWLRQAGIAAAASSLGLMVS
ncbi:hypothetical protein CAI21_18800 [Alkalilimnicola ehrlichii]|uniref:Phosphatidate cytidylyltransferase n=1 Tax=Alkalilimnicola ehrlichii TaxID=351052 RepID=A0A3E0WIF1_9GAMM|nr:hypothetical protein [Alkalilimnicola ehrlichii]RFA25576.1 hypothetical protein CAI21_18800 [Alkalilimnicola ehrlichii]RFA32704.1 hypothetical protein CAL65_19060 [Alkalilimnicola ehrlichii]